MFRECASSCQYEDDLNVMLAVICKGNDSTASKVLKGIEMIHQRSDNLTGGVNMKSYWILYWTVILKEIIILPVKYWRVIDLRLEWGQSLIGIDMEFACHYDINWDFIHKIRISMCWIIEIYKKLPIIWTSILSKKASILSKKTLNIANQCNENQYIQEKFQNYFQTNFRNIKCFNLKQQFSFFLYWTDCEPMHKIAIFLSNI